MSSTKKHIAYLGLLLIGVNTAFTSDSRPNILWLFSDDHAFQAIGAYGGRLQSSNLTPNLDSIAR